MGSTLNGVRMTYAQLTAVANEMRQQAEITRTAITALNSDVTALRPTWDGACRKAFDTCFDLFAKEVQHVPKMLDEIGKSLDNTATLIKQGDADAKTAVNTTIVSDTAA
jgi:WXG100 family type VII secretion target